MRPAVPEGRSRPASVRLRRSRHWLGLAISAHGITGGTVIAHALSGQMPSVAVAGAAAVLAAGPFVALFWYEHRHPSDVRPAVWPARALATSLPQTVAVGLAAAGTAGWSALAGWQQIMLLAVPLVQIGPTMLASRLLRHPLTPDLGELPVEVRVPIRSGRPGRPPWLCQDDVVLTEHDVVLTLRPGPRWKFVERIPLAQVTEVETQQAAQQGDVWLVLDGHEHQTPPGDVVIVRRCGTARTLPVHEAAAFAEVLRARIATTRHE